jgi:hypothetical protein
VTREGDVKDYPRQSIHVWHLVARALLAMGYAGKGLQAQPADLFEAVTEQRRRDHRAPRDSTCRRPRGLNGLPAINAARPGPLGNPFVVGQDGDRAECVRLFEVLLGGYIALTTKASVESQRLSAAMSSTI